MIALEELQPPVWFMRRILVPATEEAALDELDLRTGLLDYVLPGYNVDVMEVLRRVQKPIPTDFQWPIVASLRHAKMQPMVVFWLALKPNALPEPIMRGWVYETFAYVVKRSHKQSARTWRIVSVLEELATAVTLRTIDRLSVGRQTARELYNEAHDANTQLLAAAMYYACQKDPVQAMSQSVVFLLDAYPALDCLQDFEVAETLARIVQRLCTQALQKHPQKDLLKKDF